MYHHNSGKIIAEDFLDCHSKTIYRSDIRAYISTQIQIRNIQNSSKQSINNVMNHFKMLAEDRNKIKSMLTYLLRKSKSNSNDGEKDQIVGGDFLSSDHPPKIIPRAAIRAFIYECIVINSKICNIKNKKVKMVMDHFHMQEKDWNKVKKMILIILNRDNKILPPITYEPQNSDDDDKRRNNYHIEPMDLQLKSENLQNLILFNEHIRKKTGKLPQELQTSTSKRKRALTL